MSNLIDLNYSNWTGGLLASAITSVQTSIQLAPGSLNNAPTANFIAVLSAPPIDQYGFKKEREVILANTRSADTITSCVRGYDGSTAQSWATNDSCVNYISAAFFNYLKNSILVSMPIGGIILWSGVIAEIPQHWHLCDGTNNTPDLRDKFIIGASQDSDDIAKTNITGVLTQTGGSKDAIVPNHTHPYKKVGDSLLNQVDGSDSQSLSLQLEVDANTGDASNGEPVTNKNLPPYYALAYIMFSGV